MRKHHLATNFCLGMLFCLALTPAAANSQPKFKLVPTTLTTIIVSPKGTASVKY